LTLHTPNQIKKQVQNPTLRWIFKLFQGISVVRVNIGDIATKHKEFISTIRELTERIIRYFGKYSEKIYGLAPI